MLTPAQRKIRARIAALAMHAQGGTNTRPAYAARVAKLEAQVDPSGSLTPDERARRVRLAMSAEMSRLSLKSSRARSRHLPEAA